MWPAISLCWVDGSSDAAEGRSGHSVRHGEGAGPLAWVLPPVPCRAVMRRTGATPCPGLFLSQRGRTGGRPRGVAGLIALPSLGVALRDLSVARNLSGTRAMVPLAAPCPPRTLNPGASSVPWDTVLAAGPQDPDANWHSVT